MIRQLLLRLRIAGTVAMVALAISAPLFGQEPDTAAARQAVEQRLGRPVSQEEILQRIRDSGLTREQAKARLRQIGFDPAVVDVYYDALEAEGPLPEGPASAEFARALERIQRAPRVDLAAEGDSVAPEPPPDSADGDGLPLFGRDLFFRVTTEFQPILYGPVDEGYRLGPGDEILLVLSGGVESAYSLEVNRQGYLIIPEVGQVPVSGMTMEELDRVLYQSLGRVYSGIRGESPSIHFQASLGRLRTNQVYLVGEVERPGAYQVSAIATVFNALYRAGGPKRSGSFRQLAVWRGGRVVGTIDLYDYLISGDSRSDLRLENGDRVHVPLAGRKAAVRGAVRRPAVYELAPGEDMRDLIRYAGGFNPEAVVSRIQVDRILPPDQRAPGMDRVFVDVALEDLLATSDEEVPVRDGDEVRIFAVSPERRHMVDVTGDVRRPGTYEWSPTLTLRELVARADGLAESAYTQRAHVYRLDRETGERRLLSVSLAGDTEEGGDLTLADRDSVVIYSNRTLRTTRTVQIDGFVKNPGTYELAEGMSIQDLILAAGGFRDGAYTAAAEVARLPPEDSRTDTTAYVLNVPLATGFQSPDPTGADGPPDDGEAGLERERIPVWSPAAAEFELHEDDRVFVRRAPGYHEPRTVMVTGEVAFPGAYVLSRRNERLTDVLERAGGFTPDVYVDGIRIVRDGNLVAVNAAEALRDPDSDLNLVLEAGDSLQVPDYDPTVLVQGAVSFESRVLYQPGAGLDYYIERAGGYSDIADPSRVTVTQKNGERSSGGRPVLLFRKRPEVTPGSTIHVPAVPQQERGGFNWDAFLSRTVSIASVTATLILAINQLSQ